MTEHIRTDRESDIEERERVLAEYSRREREVDANLYAPWAVAFEFMHDTAAHSAAQMLHRAGVFPGHQSQCMEIGFGYLGWLAHLIQWGVPEKHLHGIELNTQRADRAREILPLSDLRVGDAAKLPWEAGVFHLVVASTVLTSILSFETRRKVAAEISRVLAPGGALLWYDFAVNNPRNQHVRKVDRSELRQLFPDLRGEIRSITLAPPLARFLAPKSITLATLLEAIPWLRTHLIAVLVKPSGLSRT
jgi:ubiquinone/menaquinone biosynthesis C-methylase UbiE